MSRSSATEARALVIIAAALTAFDDLVSVRDLLVKALEQMGHNPMRVHILGTRGNVPRSAARYARHAGILIDRRILLDFGEASYVRYHPRQIFISHLHADHAIFLQRSVAFDGAIYVPEHTRALAAAKVMLRPVRAGDYRVVPVPTQHSHKVRSRGFIVEKSGRRLFYSSDLVSIHRRYYPRLGRLDLVIADGSFMRRGGLVRLDPATGRRFGHAGIPDLVQLFSRFTRRIVFTHFGSWFYNDVPDALLRIASLGDGVRVSAARDGMLIRV